MFWGRFFSAMLCAGCQGLASLPPHALPICGLLPIVLRLPQPFHDVFPHLLTASNVPDLIKIDDVAWDSTDAGEGWVGGWDKREAGAEDEAAPILMRLNRV